MDDDYDEFFQIPSKAKIASCIKLILGRLYQDRLSEVTDDDVTSTSQQPEQIEGNSGLQSELEMELKAVDARAHAEKCQTTRGLLATIKKEMDLFEGGGSRGHHLQMAFNHLQTIKPTSVKSERAFSAAGYICNKVR